MTTTEKVKKRGTYYRLKDSDRWHWMEECQFWPPRLDPEQEQVVVCLLDRPSYGVMCDHCQNLEEKNNAKTTC